MFLQRKMKKWLVEFPLLEAAASEEAVEVAGSGGICCCGGGGGTPGTEGERPARKGPVLWPSNTFG